MTFHAKLTEPLFSQYLANPVAMDNVVRQELKIPSNKYYTIGVVSGYCYLTHNRESQVKKISKSDAN